jgi:hypothetical protein
MLSELHLALQDFIYREGKIDPSDVDIAFEVPTKDFIDRLVRPTVDLYLVELQENVELRQPQFKTSPRNGLTRFEALPRRIDLHYLVTALTTNADDAFRLIWRVLGVLIRTPEFPSDFLSEDLALDFPIVSRVAQPDDSTRLLDIWSAAGTEARPSFGYVLTAPMDMGLSFDIPLVLSRTVRYSSLNRIGGSESRSPAGERGAGR